MFSMNQAKSNSNSLEIEAQTKAIEEKAQIFVQNKQEISKLVDYKLDQSKKENFDLLNNMKKSHSSAMSKARKDLDHIHHHLKASILIQSF